MPATSRERRLGRFAAECTKLLREELLSVIEARPGAAPIETVLVVRSVTPQVLDVLSRKNLWWRLRGIATPLVIDREYLRNAADVFPMELHELHENHRLIVGEDPFASLVIDDGALRYQCEHEARGKLQRLRELYIEAPSGRAVRNLLADSSITFVVLMRNTLRLAGHPAPRDPLAVVDGVEGAFGGSWPTFRAVVEVAGGARWPSEPARDTFARYLEEVTQFVHQVDALYRKAAGS